MLFRNRRTCSLGEIRRLLEETGRVVLRRENLSKGFVEFWEWRYDGKAYCDGVYGYDRGGGYVVRVSRKRLPVGSCVSEIKNRINQGWELI